MKISVARRGRIFSAVLLSASLLCLLRALPAAENQAGLPAPQQTGKAPSSLPTLSNPATPSSPYVIKKTVRRVVLDVVVTDSSRKPVRGLAQKDFTIAEDGNAQQILSFDEHDFDATADSALTNSVALPPNTFLNVPVGLERGPLYVLLLDLVNTHVEDQPYARQQLLKFIQNKPIGTRFAIFALSDKLQLVQGFTANQSELFAAVDIKSSRPHVPMIFLEGMNFGRGNTGMMVGVFRDLGHYLDGIPGRKNLIWFSGGFPMSLFPTNEDAKSYRDQIKDTLDTMARNQIALYTVDATALPVEVSHAPVGDTGGAGVYDDFRTGANGAPGGSAGSSRSGGGGAPGGGGGGVGYNMLLNQYMVENAITEATGGRAIYSTNDLAGALEDAVESGANYYTLTYSPSNQHFDGNLRKISVEMARHGYQLAYRRSYYGEDPETPKRHDTQERFMLTDRTPAIDFNKTLLANIQHGAPMEHQLIFKAALKAAGAPAQATAQQMALLAEQPAFFRAHKGRSLPKPLPPVQLQTIAIDYTVLLPQRRGQSDLSSAPNLEFAAIAYDGDGRVLNNIVQDSGGLAVSANAETNPKGLYRAQQQIEVPAGATSIRLAVRDTLTDRRGTIEVHLPLSPEQQSGSATPITPPQPAPGTVSPGEVKVN